MKTIHSFSKNKRTSKCSFPKYTSNSLQVLPLALQITTIAGNIMVSERMVTFNKKVIIHYGVVFSLSFFPFCLKKISLALIAHASIAHAEWFP